MCGVERERERSALSFPPPVESRPRRQRGAREEEEESFAFANVALSLSHTHTDGRQFLNVGPGRSFRNSASFSLSRLPLCPPLLLLPSPSSSSPLIKTTQNISTERKNEEEKRKNLKNISKREKAVFSRERCFQTFQNDRTRSIATITIAN